MGFLHEGHLSLVSAIAVSININPSQFAPTEKLFSCDTIIADCGARKFGAPGEDGWP
jgi:hypothetical protein